MIPPPTNQIQWSECLAGREQSKIVPLKLSSHLTAKLITAVSNSRTGNSIVWGTWLILMVLIVFEIDIATGPQISLSIFYLIPISLATWRFRRKIGTALSFFSAAAWGAADVLSGNTYVSGAIPFWNAAVRLGFFLIVTYMLATLCSALEWARTDVLTGILNVRGFREQAGRELARCAREGHGFTLAYFDLDNFKRMNNRWGHRFGDAALHRVGVVLARSVRRTDLAARLGGDEFVVLFPATDYLGAKTAVGNLHAALTEAFGANERPITFSIGVATFDFIPESLDLAISEADALMYVSKRNGKGMVIHRMVASPTGVRCSAI